MVVINAARLVMLNGIDRIVTRGDLADRAILLDLPVIPDAKRVTEEALWAQFEQDRPGILGTLLDADPVASVIRQWMADQSSWKGERGALYEELSRIAARTGMRAGRWPANGQALSRQPNGLDSALRPVGIVVIRERGARRRIRIACGECECGDIASVASTGRDGVRRNRRNPPPRIGTAGSARTGCESHPLAPDG